MSSEYSVRFNSMSAAIEAYEALERPMIAISEEIIQVKNALTFEIRQRAAIDNRLTAASEELSAQEDTLSRYVQAGYDALSKYQEYENKALGYEMPLWSMLSRGPINQEFLKLVGPGGMDNAVYGKATIADKTTKSWIEILTDIANKEEDAFEDPNGKTVLDYIKTCLKVLDKTKKWDKADTTNSLMSYWETLVKFWAGDKKGLSGAADLCDLFSDSTSLWSSAYDYLKEFYNEAGDFFGSKGQKLVGVLGLAGSIASYSSDILNALDDPGDSPWKALSKLTGIMDSGTTILTDLYSLAHIKDTANVLTKKTGAWSPLSIYTSIASSAYDMGGQMLSDIGDLSKDGWSLDDTGDVLVRGSLTGLESLASKLTFGVSDRVLDGINWLTGGEPLKDGETYAMRAAEGCKIVCKSIGTAIGNGIVKLQKWLRK